MTNELDKYVDAWVAFTEAAQVVPERDPHWPMVLEVMRWASDNPEKLWSFIIAANERELSASVISNLAAGPLEDLLVHHGRKFIDRIVSRATADEKFNDLLGGVWKNEMSDDVWQAVLNVRKQAW
jgi:hypothetical protein